MPSKSANRNDTLAVLRESIIGSVDLAQVESVSRFNQRLQ